MKRGLVRGIMKVLTIAILLMGCSKEKRYERLIVGKWKGSGNSSYNSQSSSTQRLFYGSPSSLGNTVIDFKASLNGDWTFNKDKTGKLEVTYNQEILENGTLVSKMSFSCTRNFKWDIEKSGDDYYLIVKYEFSLGCGYWTPYEEKYIIATLDNSKCEIRQEAGSGTFDFSYTDSQTGTTIRIQFNWNISMNKV